MIVDKTLNNGLVGKVEIMGQRTGCCGFKLGGFIFTGLRSLTDGASRITFSGGDFEVASFSSLLIIPVECRRFKTTEVLRERLAFDETVGVGMI